MDSALPRTTDLRGRGIRTVFGYIEAPDAVDTILGMEGTAQRFVIFEEFEKKLIEETGLFGDHFN